MKKNLCTVLVCALIFGVLLASCDDLSPAKPKPRPDMGGLIPDDISDDFLPNLPDDYKTEIRNLYGCYWMSGAKDNCTEIGETKLLVYSNAMSYSYENIRWSRVSDSMWVCIAYHKNEWDYSEGDRKVILRFTKDSGGIVTLWQRVIIMGHTSGPFTKGKAVERVEQGGNVFYVYDKNDPSCPKMKAPSPL